MSGKIAARLEELGITLPQAAVPAANYVPFAQSGNLLFISGQPPFQNGRVSHAGKLGAGLSIEEGYAAARICGLNILAQARLALDGDLDRVRRVVKLTAFVASSADFPDHPKVVNGCSDLMVEIFGDAGRHVRSAVGAPSLPFDCAVEIEAILEIG